MFAKIEEAANTGNINIFNDFWIKLHSVVKAKYASDLTEMAPFSEFSITIYHLLFKIILRDCTNVEFILTSSSNDPTQQSFKSHKRSLYDRNGIILFNDVLYFIDLQSKTINKIDLKPENQFFYNLIKRKIGEQKQDVAIFANNKIKKNITSLLEYNDRQENCYEILRANNCALLKYLLVHANKAPCLEADFALFYIPLLMRIVETEVSLILDKQTIEGLFYLLDKIEDHSPEMTLKFLNFLSKNFSVEDNYAKQIQEKMQKKIIPITMQKDFTYRLCLFMLTEFTKIQYQLDQLSIDQKNKFLNSQKLKESYLNCQNHYAFIYSRNFDKLEFSDFKKFNEVIFRFFIILFDNTDCLPELLDAFHSPIYDSRSYRVYNEELEDHPKLKTLFAAVKRTCAILEKKRDALLSYESASKALVFSTSAMEKLEEFDTYQLTHKSSTYHLVTSSLKSNKAKFLHSKNPKEQCEAALFLAKYYLEQARQLEVRKTKFSIETKAIKSYVDATEFEKRNRYIQAGIYLEWYLYEITKSEWSIQYNALIAARMAKLETSSPYVPQKNIDVAGSCGQIDWYNASLPLKTYPDLFQLLKEITIAELIATRNTCIHLTLIEAYLKATDCLTAAQFIRLANLYPEFVIKETNYSTEIDRLCLSFLPKIRYRLIFKAMDNVSYDDSKKNWQEFYQKLHEIKINPDNLKDMDALIDECIFWDQWRNYNAGLNTNGYEDVEQQYLGFFEKYQLNPLVILGFKEENISNVDQTAINRAYRQLMLKLHPDKRSPQESEGESKQKLVEFLKIQEAYNLFTPSMIAYCKLSFSGMKVKPVSKNPEKQNLVQLFLRGLKQINDSPANNKEKARKMALLYVNKELEKLTSRKDAELILVNLLERHTAYSTIKSPDTGFFDKFFQSSFKLNSETIPCSDAWTKIIALIEKKINTLKPDLPPSNVKTDRITRKFFTTHTHLSNNQKVEVSSSEDSKNSLN